MLNLEINNELRTYGGVLCFNKHKGCTSHDIVNKVRKLYGTKQVGHTGTLDPLAEGVLVVMVGRAVKASEYLSADTKEYIAKITLGITTDTEDITGNILSRYEGEMPSMDNVINVCKSFLGDSLQVPPMYSAIKVNGQKLMDIARKGIEIERNARPIHVDKVEVTATDKDNEYIICFKVSKGTYIRTLCSDIGKKLGTGAVMSELKRTSSGIFNIEDSYSLDDLTNMSEDERYNVLRPIEQLFLDYPKVTLNKFYSKLAHSGCEIYQNKLGTNIDDGSYVSIYDNEGFFALGQVKMFEDGSAIKPIKQFKIKD